MKTYVHYFVSQHFGKAIVTLEPDGAHAGRVRIDVALPAERSVAYTFPLERFTSEERDDDAWPEMVARIAIHQVHKHFAERGERGLFNTTHVLSADLKPWVGDLSRVPYNRSMTGHADQDAAGRLRTGLADES